MFDLKFRPGGNRSGVTHSNACAPPSAESKSCSLDLRLSQGVGKTHKESAGWVFVSVCVFVSAWIRDVLVHICAFVDAPKRVCRHAACVGLSAHLQCM